jgi:hypothetical protein
LKFCFQGQLTIQNNIYKYNNKRKKKRIDRPVTAATSRGGHKKVERKDEEEGRKT